MHFFMSKDQFDGLLNFLKQFDGDTVNMTLVDNKLNVRVTKYGDTITANYSIEIDDQDIVEVYDRVISFSYFDISCFDFKYLPITHHIEFKMLGRALELYLITADDIVAGKPYKLFCIDGNIPVLSPLAVAGNITIDKSVKNFLKLAGCMVTIQDGYMCSNDQLSVMRYKITPLKAEPESITTYSGHFTAMLLGNYDVSFVDDMLHLHNDNCIYNMQISRDIDFDRFDAHFNDNYDTCEVYKVKNVKAKKYINLGFKFGVNRNNSNLIKVYTTGLEFIFVNREV